MSKSRLHNYALHHRGHGETEANPLCLGFEPPVLRVHRGAEVSTMTAKNQLHMVFFALFASFAFIVVAEPQEQHDLYVALPGSDDADPDRSIRILVFDITNAHRFVRRIPLWPATRGEDSEAVRGTAASARTGRLYISTTKRLAAIDLKTDKIVWERSYENHCCDRLAVSPDGQTIYAPAFGRAKWYVIHAATGELRATIGVTGWPRETMYSRDGKHAYLAAWESPVLSVSDASSHEIVKTVGPFSASLCPFTLNAKETLAFANVDGLGGFEVGDLQRSEEHTSELQSLAYLVCRLLLEKKKKKQ